MDVEQILDIPQGEIEFLYPSDARADRFDPRFKTLRVQRQGLREWNSFEEDPAYLQEFMKRPTGYQVGWKPSASVIPWTRYLASETNMVGSPEVDINAPSQHCSRYHLPRDICYWNPQAL